MSSSIDCGEFRARTQGWCVEWINSQRDFIAGTAKEPILLSRFMDNQNLYAVGPLEQARGEISVFYGVPLISTVVNHAVTVDTGFGYRAGFLVYATVDHWRRAAILSPGNNEQDLSEQLLALAVQNGIDIAAPFPFLIRGRIDHATFHVLCNQSDGKYGPELHEQAKIRFEIAHEVVEIIGFHSRHHHGVFTPSDSNLHMHFRTVDNRVAGHIESIRWGQSMSISVPAVANGFSDRAVHNLATKNGDAS
jgi:acetolactate decarboxylase